MNKDGSYSIILDPDRLPDIGEIEEYLEQSPAHSYSEKINLNKKILGNNHFFKRNDITNFPYQRNRNTNNNDLDISVILLCHGSGSSFGTIIEKKHDFWEGNRESHMMYNCNAETVVGIKANIVRLYNDVGYNVAITSSIYKILIGIFYFNSIVCLLLFYLTLNLFRSRMNNNNKIYPYKKLYTIGRQIRLIPNPLKNIQNNSNVQNSDFEEVTKDKKFHYYIPNSRLGLVGQDGQEDENYICFMIQNKGKLQVYKFMLNYESVQIILNYNGITDKKQYVYFIDNLNIADIITIIYNTIQQKILPKYNINQNLHISLDLMFCKGGLAPEDYVLTKKEKNKCYQLTNDFGYIYVGHIKYCISDLCEKIKYLQLHLKKNNKKIIIDIEDYFKKILNMEFDESYSQESVGQFIEQLVIKEKKLGRQYLKELKNIFNYIQTLKITDFSQSGSGKNKSKTKSKAKSKKPTKSKKIKNNLIKNF